MVVDCIYNIIAEESFLLTLKNNNRAVTVFLLNNSLNAFIPETKNGPLIYSFVLVLTILLILLFFLFSRLWTYINALEVIFTITFLELSNSNIFEFFFFRTKTR